MDSKLTKSNIYGLELYTNFKPDMKMIEMKLNLKFDLMPIIIWLSSGLELLSWDSHSLYPSVADCRDVLGFEGALNRASLRGFPEGREATSSRTMIENFHHFMMRNFASL